MSGPGSAPTPPTDPAHEELRRTARHFLDTEVRPRIDALEQGRPGVLRELLVRSASIGLLSPEVPEELGGARLDVYESTLVSEALAGYASFSVAHGVHSGLSTFVLLHLGTDEQRARFLPGFASGERIAAFAVTEAGAGSDIGAMSTRAAPIEGGRAFSLRGCKCWISNAGIADVFVVLARLEEGRFAFFLLERGQAGSGTKRRWASMARAPGRCFSTRCACPAIA